MTVLHAMGNPLPERHGVDKDGQKEHTQQATYSVYGRNKKKYRGEKSSATDDCFSRTGKRGGVVLTTLHISINILRYMFDKSRWMIMYYDMCIKIYLYDHNISMGMKK